MSQSSMAIRWGICSAGKISHDFLVALKTLPPEDHQAVAIASRDLARSQEYAKKHDIPRAYGSYEELARDPDVDIVYVGSVHTQHHRLAILFLRAQKNVLCEKPLAMNADEVRDMIRVAREHKVFLMEGFWTRFFPVSEQIRTLLARKALGDVKVIQAHLGFPMEDVQRLVDKKLGGGVIMDLGCYCVQFASMVFGPERPQSIIASGLLRGTGVDETASMILNYSGNRQAVLTVSMVLRLPGEALIGGTEGVIQIPSHMNCPTIMFLKGNRWEWPLPPSPEPLFFENDIGLRYEAEHVRQCLLEGLKESPVMPLCESEVIATILDEARRQIGVFYEGEDTTKGQSKNTK
ncbi:PREDICTED: trans-1,2-dihydrobenzene-1,2-diol dehydrogenase-like [Gekko japonicus]|uniref:Trans-1,2-dihydrobenzene-1,2-diol dehydrogenase n=1 Tax=Gekko japonicus TaxID=146911 RepID=A0ABM1KJZ3_GEKJA|nr:PREDICTED: trans-1,2-dihydrobenzene-1,2-diol dehydrogenase-like [Gekko japonicus]